MVGAPRQRVRRRALQQRLESRVPGWYSPVLHLLGNATLTAAVVYVFAAQLRGGDPRAAAWLALPAAIAVGNLVEYLVHRYPMHRRTRWLDRFFKSHTLIHHRVFDERDFELGRARDAYFVLTTVHTTALSLIVLGAAYFGLAALAGVDVAAIACIGLSLYAFAVEIMHLVLHLPGRYFARGPLRWSGLHHLRDHHRAHHDPRLMRRFNFNLAFPLADVLLGTRLGSPAEAVRPARSPTPRSG